MEKKLSNIFKTTNVMKLTKAILKSSYRVLQESLCHVSCMIFEEKYLSGYILLTDQISLSGCLYFVRYWAICVLQCPGKPWNFFWYLETLEFIMNIIFSFLSLRLESCFLYYPVI